MSPKKSPGQAVGQLLSESGREVVGRTIDVSWSIDRPHRVGTDNAPRQVLDRLSEAHRAQVGDEKWVWWRPCFNRFCECSRPPSTEGVLDRFLALEDASPEDVEGFVFQHGGITGCVHLRAHRHCDEFLSVRNDELFGPSPDAFVFPFYFEAPSAYRAYARLFRTYLTLAADIQAGDDGDIELWKQLVASIPEDSRVMLDPVWDIATFNVPTEELRAMDGAAGAPDDAETVAKMVLRAGVGPDLLAVGLSALMYEDTISLAVEWPETEDGYADRPRIGPVTSTFGILTYQLAVAIQGNLFAICSNCHKTYAPTRRPQAGRDNYCLACRDVRKAAYKRRRHQATENGND